ncbi:hypothetical protein MHTCC0001_20010 [Flavobacteriaceae bacterium MHTCC 0001]
MNLIEKHHIEINCSKQGTANLFKDELGPFFEHHLYPKLDELVQRYDVSDSVWSIEKLEIEVPKLVLTNWKNDLVNTILHQVEEYFKTNSIYSGEKSKTLKSESGNIIPKKEIYQNLLMNYLFKGTLPASAIADSLENVMDNVVIDDAFITLLLKEAHQNNEGLHTALLRLVYNLPENLHVAIAKTLDILNGFQEIKKMVHKQSVQYVLFGQLLYWLTLVKNETKMHIIKSDAEAIVQIAHRYFGMTIANVLATIDLWQDEIAQTGIEGKQLNTFTGGIGVLKHLIISQNITFETPRSQQGYQNDIDAILDAVQGNTEKEKPKPHAYHYVSNAGLVILQPYFSILFQNLNYVEGSEWKKPYLQHRAVLLTQYLIWGVTKIFESDLILNKILCGVPINETVSTEWEITENEKEQCQNLLESVIDYWKVLKNTSVEALQETFLQREAKLITHKEDRYELIVAQKGVDILLEQLPWGIGILKTPWMAHYLSCQWT